MRTTIRIDDNLLIEAKKLVASSKQSLTSLIEDALREIIARKKNRSKASYTKLTVFKGDGLHSGVDLDDSSALLDIMES